MANNLLSVENLRVAYPTRQWQAEVEWAVDGVSFAIAPGERLGFVGESGCGKSTLGRASMRLLPKSSWVEGEVKFEDRLVFSLDPHQLRQFRGEVVALVFQDPMTRLDPLMTIGNHCIETLQAHQPQLSRSQAKENAIAVLEAVKIPASRWDQYPHEFSGGMRQRVAIALALLLDPKLIIADEPTTSLDVTVASEILQELTRLCKERNLALMLISHDLAMIGEYCDRVAVMYDGKIVEMGNTQTLLSHPQHQYTRSLLNAALLLKRQKAEGRGQKEGQGDRDTESEGRGAMLAPELDNAESEGRDAMLASGEEKAEILLGVTDLKQHYTLEAGFLQNLLSRKNTTIKAVDGVSFDLRKGETFGLVGESGCGKSTLSRTILQLVRATSGSVTFLGKEITQLPETEIRKMRRHIQMIFQDPLACLNPLMSVGESIADPLLIHKLATPTEAKKRVEQVLERVSLTPVSDYYYRYPRELSGGQQQRVAIARALITQPQLIICDEPVSMLDATVQTQVLELMQSLKDEFNLTYLFITHDLTVARFFCDRIAVMNAGQIVELGTAEDIFTQPQHPYTQTLLSAAPHL
ncbi:ABC transporter ATP-binding protein [Lusitaniella coriacea LEGE 07157]|uniref:ABC transporter ATP-binding protein n=1 Tax=Lusitaniella coriacea LEGE 07157 TaxID=945747 RepID=A0A8J7DYH9_9CYAN|nr:ABC transporter ATP-binding protein [Lusitaniella coriacea]MBE9117831.1 ABC transporter ATP-binding protein [Lusitaniella coriacea LEGE 07157]